MVGWVSTSRTRKVKRKIWMVNQLLVANLSDWTGGGILKVVLKVLYLSFAHINYPAGISYRGIVTRVVKS